MKWLGVRGVPHGQLMQPAVAQADSAGRVHDLKRRVLRLGLEEAVDAGCNALGTLHSYVATSSN